MEPIRRDNWSAGANNIAPRDRLPEASLRAAVSVDPLPGGRLAARARYQRRYAGSAVRAVLALGSKLLIADGTELVEFNYECQRIYEDELRRRGGARRIRYGG